MSGSTRCCILIVICVAEEAAQSSALLHILLRRVPPCDFAQPHRDEPMIPLHVVYKAACASQLEAVESTKDRIPRSVKQRLQSKKFAMHWHIEAF